MIEVCQEAERRGLQMMLIKRVGDRTYHVSQRSKTCWKPLPSVKEPPKNATFILSPLFSSIITSPHFFHSLPYL